jgi:hypothetical protein
VVALVDPVAVIAAQAAVVDLVAVIVDLVVNVPALAALAVPLEKAATKVAPAAVPN